MIKDALRFIIDQLNAFIQPIDPGNADDMVVLGNIALVDAYNDDQASPLQNRIVASVVNVEQDSVLRNLPRTTVRLENGNAQARTQEAPVIINLYVMFSANNTNYENALYYLSAIVAFFQQTQVFTPTPPISNPPFQSVPSFEKMIFDLYTMSFEEQNHLWGTLGGKYIPSVLYKVRLVAIQTAPVSDSSTVRRIRTDETGL